MLLRVRTMEYKPYIIVVGNEKGGTGKSTLSMHVAVMLLNMGFSVGTIDIDSRQGTFSRYIQNREKTSQELGDDSIKLPTFYAFTKSENNDRLIAEREDTDTFINLIHHLSSTDIIVIDTPGSDMFASRLAHSYADTLITPINDSFIDMDLLVRIDKNDRMRPSIYSEMVWNQKKAKLARHEGSIDWIVVKNRLTNINSKNKVDIDNVLNQLSKRIGFRIASGFAERVIFKELFLNGLTVLDITGKKMSMSHLAAKQELRSLVSMITIPDYVIMHKEKRINSKKAPI